MRCLDVGLMFLPVDHLKGIFQVRVHSLGTPKNRGEGFFKKKKLIGVRIRVYTDPCLEFSFVRIRTDSRSFVIKFQFLKGTEWFLKQFGIYKLIKNKKFFKEKSDHVTDPRYGSVKIFGTEPVNYGKSRMGF